MEHKPGSVQVNSQKDNCCSCAACEQICPRSCIQMCADVDGFLYPQVDVAACVQCGLCLQACQYDSSSYHHVCSELPRYAVARARADVLRQSSSSGGLLPVMADWTCERGGLVAGVCLDGDFQAQLQLAHSKEAAAAFRGSKYVQCRNHSAYRDVRSALRRGQRVLFCGTPCLVAGLYAYLGEAPTNLVTVDFICHGAPSPKLFEHYRRWLSQRFGAEILSLQFRDKARGWGHRLKVEFADGQVYAPECLDDPYYHMFLASAISSPACYRCPYTKASGREADLTVGDAWKAPRQFSDWDDNSGVSVLIVNSSSGEEFLQELGAQLEVRPCALGLIDQSHLHQPAKAHPDRREFFACWHRHGVARAFRSYARPRPLLRRFKTRLRKVWQGLLDRCGLTQSR